MAIKDVIEDIKSRSNLVDIIKLIGIGEFPFSNYTQRFRGSHGTHASTSTEHVVVDPVRGHWRCFSCGQSGSVVDWVLSTKFNGNRAALREAVNFLAKELGTSIDDVTLDSTRYAAYSVLTEVATMANAELLSGKHPEVLEFIATKYGLTEDTLHDLCIGYLEKLPKSIAPEEMVNAGLLGEDGKFRLRKHIIFPHFYGNQVRWMAGRWPKEIKPGDPTPKYVALKKTNYVQKVVYNFDFALDQSYSDPLIITEGLTDAAIAYQKGLRAVGTGGATTGSELVPDLVRLCKLSNTPYILFDSELNQAGYKGARALAQLLVNAAIDPLIVDLPRGERDHLDLCEFFQTESVERLELCLLVGWENADGQKRHPETLAEIAIRECPSRPQADYFQSVVQTFAPLPDVLSAKYMKQLAEHTESKVVDIKALVKQRRAIANKKPLTLDEDYSSPPYIAQDYVFDPDTQVWSAHRTVYAPHKDTQMQNGEEVETTKLIPFYIVSDLFPGGGWSVTSTTPIPHVPDEWERLIPSSDSINNAETDEYSWSFKHKDEYNLLSFLAGSSPVLDLGELYNEIVALFNTYILYPEPRDVHVLATFVLFTYVFMGFDSTPYIHCNGPQGSAKSHTLQLLSSLCFNSVGGSSISTAAASRTIHANRPTLLLDEAEKMHNPQPGSSDWEFSQMAKGGYCKTHLAKIHKCVTETHAPTSFFTYCPKVFGSIKAIGPVLASRTIRIHCQPVNESDLHKIKDLRKDMPYLRGKWQRLRNMLQIWSLTRFREVRERYDQTSQKDYSFLRGRERDIWLPLLAIAEIVDTYGGLNVASTMSALIADKIRATLVDPMQYDFNILIMKSLYDILTDTPDLVPVRPGPADNPDIILLPSEIAVRKIKERLMEEQSWDDESVKFTTVYFNRSLRDIGAVDQKAKSIAYKVRGNAKKIAHIPLSMKALEYYLDVRGQVQEVVNDDTETNLEEITGVDAETLKNAGI